MSSVIFNPFVPNVPFLYPPETSEKHQKTVSFFMFSGGRERVHWEQMGQLYTLCKGSLHLYFALVS